MNASHRVNKQRNRLERLKRNLKQNGLNNQQRGRLLDLQKSES